MKLKPIIAILISVSVLRAAEPSTRPGPNAPLDPAAYKPPIRVACLGDSITFGVGAKGGWSWPDQLDRMLGNDWDVRNFGLSGTTISRGDKHQIWSQKVYREALEFHPDAVIIMLGTNDTKPENWENKKELPKLYKDLGLSFQKLSSAPSVFLAHPPYVAKKGAFGINEAGIIEEIPIIDQVARDWGFGITDVHGALAGHDEFFGDNVHPNNDGATLIAKTVYKSLTGRDWSGDVPAPGASDKPKPKFRIIEHPGDLSYREAYGLIVSTGIPAEKLDPIKNKYDDAVIDVESKIAQLESQIHSEDALRMKFKREDPKLAGEHKKKVGELTKELEKFKRDQLLDLIRMIPEELKDEFGAQWVTRYVLDRLAPIAETLNPEQKKQIRELCKCEGAAFGHINNTPERSIEDVETYKAVYEKILNADQKKRVESK